MISATDTLKEGGCVEITGSPCQVISSVASDFRRADEGWLLEEKLCLILSLFSSRRNCSLRLPGRSSLAITSFCHVMSELLGKCEILLLEIRAGSYVRASVCLCVCF